MAGFISERWPASNRNGGRHQIGIGGRIESEFAQCRYKLINFDIPLESHGYRTAHRTHRPHRNRDVFVFNLVARGTVEERVLRPLDDKVNMFELVVGEAGAILGELEEERNFADLV